MWYSFWASANGVMINGDLFQTVVLTGLVKPEGFEDFRAGNNSLPPVRLHKENITDRKLHRHLKAKLFWARFESQNVFFV
jgi:hypothetical protein